MSEPRAVIYDVEIRYAPAPRPGEAREEGIRYCRDWRDYSNMGLAVVCAFDTYEKRPRVFLKDNLKGFGELCEAADYCVGYNNASFDNGVLFANGIIIPREKTYDLLYEIWAGLGLNPDKFYSRTHGGYGLNPVAMANNCGSKTGSGAHAPTLWQRGKYGEVIDYCTNDVEITRRIFYQVMRSGIVTCPKTGNPIKIRKPAEERALTTLFALR